MSLPNKIIAILDVGHGNSTIVKDESGVIIIDACQRSGLLEFLSEQEVGRIDTILISHADKDHIGGVIGLISSNLFTLGKIRLNTDSLKDSDEWDDMLYELDILNRQNKIDFRPSLTINDSGEYDLEYFKIQILGPSNYLAARGPGSEDRHGRTVSTNSISAVVRVRDINSNPIVLIPGDIDGIGLDDLAEHNNEASAQILLFPHHGGLPGSSGMVEEFTIRLCELVLPKVVIFSNERGKRYRTPRSEIVSILISKLQNVRILCTQLSEDCAAVLPREHPTHLVPVFSKGRAERKCCAGSIIIDISLLDPVLPIFENHREFINISAPTALCNSR